jgi:anaerobic magnesium-protoporphyrin IX monomethyl ester cyclase
VKILLINPPYQTFTSNFGVGHQVPLGLLMIGGPLIDSGHRVELLDAECLRLSCGQIAREVRRVRPDVVMTGHAGSTPAHPICVRMLRAVKQACPSVTTVYGGVYPTYHSAAILRSEPSVDFIVRGEGEATATELATALEAQPAAHRPLGEIRGLTFRESGRITVTPPRAPIENLDSYRTGWELIRHWDRYRCFGLGRAAIVQFSRGCPHRCTHCGQHQFWVRWRHRDPHKLVDEIEWLSRVHRVRFITLADENPTTSKPEWRHFLELLAERQLPVYFFATIRASDIVRDADILDLYRKSGILYVLMGIESTDDRVLEQIRKGSTSRIDLQACQLLRRQRIFSILGHIVGLQDETPSTFRTAFSQLSLYDGDYLNAMYVTPHDWTPLGIGASTRPIVETDQRLWDYRHQVLGQQHLSPARLLLMVKWLELRFHLRPQRLYRILKTRSALHRHQWLWCLLHIGMVWILELGEIPRIACRRTGSKRARSGTKLSRALPVLR